MKLNSLHRKYAAILGWKIRMINFKIDEGDNAEKFLRRCPWQLHRLFSECLLPYALRRISKDNSVSGASNGPHYLSISKICKDIFSDPFPLPYSDTTQVFPTISYLLTINRREKKKQGISTRPHITKASGHKLNIEIKWHAVKQSKDQRRNHKRN